MREHRNVAVVGAGVVGLAHAWRAAKNNRSVVLFERHHRAIGASIRNFGLIWPCGLPHGRLHQLALRSRNVWLEVLDELKLPFGKEGALHVAYSDDEWNVMREFAELGPGFGHACGLIDAAETLAWNPALRADELRGSLRTGSELSIDSAAVIASWPRILAEMGVTVRFGTAVLSIDRNTLRTPDEHWTADQIIVCGGEDFELLYPSLFRGSGITRCKTQMLRLWVADQRLRLPVATGLSLRHYPSFQICPSLPKLAHRVAEQEPELDRWGIHLLIKEAGPGEWIVGDSHEYEMQPDPFNKDEINRLLLSYLQRITAPGVREVMQSWHGVFAKHPTELVMRFDPEPGVEIVCVTTGLGMTLSNGLALETFGGSLHAGN